MTEEERRAKEITEQVIELFYKKGGNLSAVVRDFIARECPDDDNVSFEFSYLVLCFALSELIFYNLVETSHDKAIEGALRYIKNNIRCMGKTQKR